MSAGETKEVEFELADEQKATVRGGRSRDPGEGAASARRRRSPGRRASSRRSRSCAPTSRRGCASSSRASWSSSSGRTRWTLSSPRPRFDSLEPMVERRTAELATGFVRSLERRGLSLEVYLAMTGQTQEQIVGRLREEAEQALKRELALDAVADRLGPRGRRRGDRGARPPGGGGGRGGPGRPPRRRPRERRASSSCGATCACARRSTRSSPGSSGSRSSWPRAREKLWTPEKEKAPTEMKIWTPGSEGGT